MVEAGNDPEVKDMDADDKILNDAKIFDPQSSELDEVTA